MLREYNEMKKRNKNFWNFCGIDFIQTMETSCVSCEKYTANKNSNVRRTKQNRLMLLSNCTIYGKKRSTFIKDKKLYNFD